MKILKAAKANSGRRIGALFGEKSVNALYVNDVFYITLYSESNRISFRETSFDRATKRINNFTL